MADAVRAGPAVEARILGTFIAANISGGVGGQGARAGADRMADGVRADPAVEARAVPCEQTTRENAKD